VVILSLFNGLSVELVSVQ